MENYTLQAQELKITKEELEALTNKLFIKLKNIQTIARHINNNIKGLNDVRCVLVNELNERKGDMRESVNRLFKGYGMIQKQFNELSKTTQILSINKRTQEDKRRAQILLEQEAKIISLQEELHKLTNNNAMNSKNMLEIANKLQTAETNIKQLNQEIEQRDTKIKKLVEKEKTESNERHKMKAEYDVLIVEIKKLKSQLQIINEEKNKLEVKSKTLIADLNSVHNIVKVKEAAIEVCVMIIVRS